LNRSKQLYSTLIVKERMRTLVMLSENESFSFYKKIVELLQRKAESGNDVSLCVGTAVSWRAFTSLRS
jgi:hypothetical protein